MIATLRRPGALFDLDAPPRLFRQNYSKGALAQTGAYRVAVDRTCEVKDVFRHTGRAWNPHGQPPLADFNLDQTGVGGRRRDANLVTRSMVEHQRILERLRRAPMRAPARDQMFIDQLFAKAFELDEDSSAGF